MNRMIDKLKQYSVPELCDGAGNAQMMDVQIKPYVTTDRIAGPARTVDVPAGEGALVADAILQLEPGEVLVVAGKGHCQTSYWGDHRSYCAKLKQAAGVVIDGAFRDIDECEKIGFPIYARAVTGKSAGKSGAGQINVPVQCGGIMVQPGDFIVGDRNGVIVINPEDAAAIIERAADKIKRQQAVIEEMERTGKVIVKVV